MSNAEKAVDERNSFQTVFLENEGLPGDAQFLYTRDTPLPHPGGVSKAFIAWGDTSVLCTIKFSEETIMDYESECLPGSRPSRPQPPLRTVLGGEGSVSTPATVESPNPPAEPPSLKYDPFDSFNSPKR